MAASLMLFAEIVVIQEPAKAGEQFVSSIAAALKGAEYRGTVKAVTLPEKDARALWLTYKDTAQFTAALEQVITATPPIDLYPEVPRTADLIFQVRNLLTRHLFFRNPRSPLLIAVWILGTYIYQSFTVFGYLWANSAEKRSGKSRLLEFLEKLTSNATPRLSNVNVATIFRLANKQQTLILDELENSRVKIRKPTKASFNFLIPAFRPALKLRGV